jgi:predicted transcriptional regulator
MSAEEIVDYNKEIEEAEQRILNGEFTTHESVVQSLDKWK